MREPGHDPVFVLGDPPEHGPPGRGAPAGVSGTGSWPDSSSPPGGTPAVLPLLALAERLVVDDPRTCFALTAVHPEAGHHLGDDFGPLRRHHLAGHRGFPAAARRCRAGRSPGPGRRGQIDPSARPQGARSAGPGGAGTRTPEYREPLCARPECGRPSPWPTQAGRPGVSGEALRLAPGQLERRVLGLVSVTQPGVVVAAQHAGVVLEFHQVQPPLAEDQRSTSCHRPRLSRNSKFDQARNGSTCGSNARTMLSPSAS